MDIVGGSVPQQQHKKSNVWKEWDKKIKDSQNV